MNEAWAALIAAFFAAIAATIGLVITKENKTSEFRQAWIQELRTCVSLFNAKLSSVWQSAKDGNEITREDKHEINRLLTEINLRINYGKKSDEEKNFIDCVLEITKSAFSCRDDFFLLQENLTKTAHYVLKSEWERVKRGETIYKICSKTCFNVSWLIFLVGLIYLIAHIDNFLNALLN